jgi:hypothetical protein
MARAVGISAANLTYFEREDANFMRPAARRKWFATRPAIPFVYRGQEAHSQ